MIKILIIIGIIVFAFISCTIVDYIHEKYNKDKAIEISVFITFLPMIIFILWIFLSHLGL